MHGPPTLPPPQKYLALPNPRSNSDSVFHHAFAPRQRLPPRIRSPTTSSTAYGNHHIACPETTMSHRYSNWDSDSFETTIDWSSDSMSNGNATWWFLCDVVAMEDVIGERMRYGRRYRKCNVEVHRDFCNLGLGFETRGMWATWLVEKKWGSVQIDF